MTGLWNCSVFGSAFLSFVVQPMLGKWLLPGFGGSPSTWAACMVFFQGMLLLGYAYAHVLVRVSRPRAQLVIHCSWALVAGIVALTLRQLPEISTSTAPPALRILWLLLCQAGPAYLLLASTAPLLQHWAAGLGARAPHRLYAVSNAGSLGGLLAYPVWIEGAVPIGSQFGAFCWSCAVFAVASSACAVIALRTAVVVPARPSSPPSAAGAWRWAVYAFVPSVLLLAVTNHITVDVAPMPLLWVVPLALYLISFIAAFAGIPAAWRSWLVALFVVASLGLALNALAQGTVPLWRQLGCSLSGLFLAALLCHDALVRDRPHAADSTLFYLWIALGGVLGGVFVSFVAPWIFDDYYELELATAASYGVLWWSRTRAQEAASLAQRRWLVLGASLCLPLMAANIVWRTSNEGRSGRVLSRSRSFLGSLRVIEFSVGRMLTHGRIRHGMQLAGDERRRWATMYYGPGTAAAQLLGSAHDSGPRRIGVVGLGVGTLAAYGRAGDVLRFYELDPDVLEAAQRWFTFLRDTRAKVTFALGDGRLQLAREPEQRFDALVLDAFSSDAVPAHLLTREAFGLYLRHLAAQGVLLANVSNRHLAVDRVVRAAARAHGLACEVVETLADKDHFVSKVRWAVIARDAAALEERLGALPRAAPSGADVLWTDAQASIWSILR